MSILGNRAEDICFNNQNDFFETVGYLATPGRVGFFEAEVPDDGREVDFQLQFPGQSYRLITQGVTSGGNPMKYNVQYRIYLNSIDNCPPTLYYNKGEGRGTYTARINKAIFVERLVERFGFRFGYGVSQNNNNIRNIIVTNYPLYIADFDRGYNL